MQYLCAAVVLLAAACSLDVGAIAPGLEDGGARDALARDSGARDVPISDVAPVDSGADSTPPWDALIDTGPRTPTALVTVADSGNNNGHPTVIWDGARFQVAVIVAVSGGAEVEVFAMRPGDISAIDRRRISTGGARERRGTELAAGPGARLAIGWHEWDGSEWDVVVAIEPSSPLVYRRYDGAAAAPDHGSVALFWEGAELLGVVREAAPGSTESARDVRFDPPPVMAEPVPLATAAALGGMDGESGLGGPFVALGQLGTLSRHTSSFFVVGRVGIPSPVEASSTVLAGGSVFSLWTGRPASGRTVYAWRLDPVGGVYVTGLSARVLGWDGPDPTVDTVGDQAVGAYIDESTGGRIVTVGMLDRDANLVGGPCPLANLRPVANDPVIACGGGYCAIVWMEATDYRGTDFITRVVQLPVAPFLVCP